MSNLTAVISADVTGFKKSVDEAKTILEKYQNTAKKTSNEINKNVSVTNEQVTAYNRVIKTLSKVQSGTMTTAQAEKALANQVKELKVQWANLSDEAKKNDFGKSVSKSLGVAEKQLKVLRQQIKATNQELANTNAKAKGLTTSFNIGGLKKGIGDVTSAMSTLGVQGGSTLSMLGSGAGLLANPYVLAGAAVAGATYELIDYNKKLEETLHRTEQVTGLSGNALNSLRNGIKSVADTWGKDYNDVLATVDTLMSQFGIDGESALNIVRDGLVGGCDEAGKMSELIESYAGSFNDAGISASELVAIIGNTRSGIFSEEGMALIQMGAKNIRSMSDSARESLKAIGVDADGMVRKLQDGSMSTVQAIQEISSHLKGLSPQSQEVGDVLQDIFGKKGSKAGYELVTALADVETNLDIIKQQTGEEGKAMENLQEADRQLENALQSLFGVSEGGFSTMTTQLKADVYKAIADVINKFIELYNKCMLVRAGWAAVALNFKNTWSAIKAILRAFVQALEGIGETIEGILTLDVDKIGEGAMKTLHALSDNVEKLASDWKQNMKDAFNTTVNGHIDLVTTESASTTPTTSGGNRGGGKKSGSGGKKGGSTSTSTAKEEKKLNILEQLEAKLKELEGERANIDLNSKDAESKIKSINEKIDKQKKAIQDYKIKVGIDIDNTVLEGSLQHIDDEISKKKKQLQLAVSDESRKKIQDEIDELSGKKKAIELRLKPVVEDKDIESLQDTINDHFIEVQAKVTPRYQREGNTSSGISAQKATDKADDIKTELDFNNQLLKTYKDQYKAILEKVSAGGQLNDNEQKLANIYEQATRNVQDLSKAYKEASENAEELQRKSVLKSKTNKAIKQTIGTIGDLNSSVDSTVSGWKTLGENWEDMSPFERVTSAIGNTISTIESCISAYESINDVVKLFGDISELVSAKKVASNSAEMASDQTKMALETAQTQQTIANNTAEETSDIGKLGVKEAGAIAGATESGASLPFPANLAAIAAGIAAVVAGFAMVFSCFADGGIVGGGSKVGDHNIVAVNSSEMILNGTQQKHLFDLLNGGMLPSRGVGKNGRVEFKIKGKNLVGTMHNYNKRINKI